MACKDELVVSDQFPAGLRVFVVDDDITCLRILEQMLRRCMYRGVSFLFLCFTLMNKHFCGFHSRLSQ